MMENLINGKKPKLIIINLFLIFFTTNLHAAWLGVQLNELDIKQIKKYSFNLNSPKTIFITAVRKDSPADKSGLLPGDIIIEANNIILAEKNDVGKLPIQQFIKILNEINPEENINFRVIRDNNKILVKAKLKNHPNQKSSEIIWTRESEKYKIFNLGLFTAKPDTFVYQKYFSKDLKNKYNHQTVTCVRKNYHSYSVGIKPYDKIISVNGIKYNKSSIDKARAGYNNVEILRGNKIIKKRIIGNPITAFTFNDKFLNCTPEYATSMCFDAHLDVFRGKPKIKPTPQERYVNNQKILECTIKHKLPVVSFYQAGKNPYFLKPNTISALISHITFKKPEGELKNLEKYNKLARESLIEYEKLFTLYPESKNGTLLKNYERLSKTIRNSILYAGNKGTSEIIKNKKKPKVTVVKSDIDRVKLKISNHYNRNGFEDVNSIKYLTRQKTFLINNNETDFLLGYLINAKNEIKWNKENLMYLNDIFEDLAEIYINKSNKTVAIKMYEEYLLKAEDNSENIYVQAHVGSILKQYHALLMITNIDFWTSSYAKKEIKKIKKYISQVETASSTHKEALLKINKFYNIDLYTNLINIDSVMNIVPTEEVFSVIDRSIKYINKSKYKEKYFYAKLSLDVNGLGKSIKYDNIEKFNYFQLNIKNNFSSAGSDISKQEQILFQTPALLMQFHKLGFENEMSELITFVEKTFDREEIEQKNIYKILLVFVDMFKSDLLKKNDNHEAALIRLENILDYIKFDINNYDTSDTIEGVIIGNIIPRILSLSVELKNNEKINYYNKIYTGKNITNLNIKDLKDISNYYEALPEDHLLLSKTYLKYLSVAYGKKFKDYVKFLDKTIYEIINNYEKNLNTPNSLQGIENPQNIYLYAAEIALIFIEGGEIKKGKKLLKYLYPKIVDNYNQQLYKSIWQPDYQKDFGLYFLKAAKFLKKDNNFINDAYKIAQIGKNTNTTRDLVKSVTNRSYSGKQGKTINKYNELQRDLSVLLRSKQYNVNNNSNIISQKNINDKTKFLYKEISILEKDIIKNNPGYFDLLKIRSVDIKDIQNKLNNQTSLIDYFFSKQKLHIVVINNDNVEIVEKNINIKNLNSSANSLQDSLRVQNGDITPYKVNESFKFNKEVFLFVKEKLKNKVYVVPDGQLNSLPLHMLASKTAKNCRNCTSVNFNLYDNYFSYLPTAETLTSIDNYKDEYSSIKKITSLNDGFKKIKNFSEKNKTLNQTFQNIKNYKKNKLKDKKKINEDLKRNSAKGYLGIGDPDLYTVNNINSINKDAKKISFIRGLSKGSITKPSDIREIYGPVKGSKTEIEFVAKFLDFSNTEVLLKEKASELFISALDLTPYNIIHFATHGEVSGALSGYNEPFLVLTPPKENMDDMEKLFATNLKYDGLLTMSEIMSLETNADLIVLSACNTGSGDQNASEGFSGLAKGFFMSGSKSILVSNWYVETFAAQKMIVNYFKNIKLNKDKTLSENLNLTMIDFIKKEKDKSHPIFWAPFVLVGSDKKILLQ